MASIAYVDPGNVAANLTAGAQYGYLLIWVLAIANGMAMLIQYQSAKLGIVTGRTLPELLSERLRPRGRRLFWLQAEVVALATDLAEVVGGAVALQLLFRLPLPVGALIVGAVSMGILAIQDHRTQQRFELVIIGLLAVITIGFLAGLIVRPPSPAGVLAGLVPHFEGRTPCCWPPRCSERPSCRTRSTSIQRSHGTGTAQTRTRGSRNRRRPSPARYATGRAHRAGHRRHCQCRHAPPRGLYTRR
ncbi:divalent metal cation transporter MntH (plasmid) [Arthrobacter sp. Hiyo8]|nr:divalent metal cation transporter MntH [Arthrobacter sp. Hiyo8]